MEGSGSGPESPGALGPGGPGLGPLFNVTGLLGNGSLRNDTFQDEALYPVPLHVVLLLTFFYVSISVAAIVGNGLVLWVVATSRRMQSVTNCFIANLALADVIIGLFAIPFQFQAALLQRWNLPEFMCPFCPFVQVVSVNVSVFTLTAIAVDRHRAVLSPLSAPPTKLRAKVIIAIIWLMSLALAAPMSVALGVIYIPDELPPLPPLPADLAATSLPLHPTKAFCTLVGLSMADMMVYRMVLVVVQYLTPLIIITLVYTRMAHRLWGSRAPGNAEDSRDATLLKNKKKVIKMLVIVVALFALCWLPLQTYNFLQNVYPSINRYRYINIIFFCCDWLAMSNSCYNPFIYGIYNEKFQREFRLRLDVCLRRSPAGRGSISRELSNLDSSRWEWPAHNTRTGTLALHRNGDKMAPLGDKHALNGSNSALSVITGHTSLTP
ncbi:hypothetical protein ONE63_006903 [Megalurothrips usitatus]|uniref:G-protein coupled receptors family 1 profile domain-containing protein n=1 Tax=Megalurothrips usitatus TaxID=439358 RepID=A0AAV7XQC6_9NEOP|nr:hypothetical protein ONE63_006903 [Megalurothrips usitatus]